MKQNGVLSKKELNIKKVKRGDIIFYICLMAFPITQFILFYICVNINSILLSFQKYDVLSSTKSWYFQNFTETFELMFNDPNLLGTARNSLVSFFLIFGIGTPLALAFSYYIYKKMPASGVFRVLLFMPSIISAIVMVTIFNFFVERAIPEIVLTIFGGERIPGLIENLDTRFATIIFYNIWVGFGVNVLMYSNSMSAIEPEIFEAAHIDGAYGIKEFWHIALPGCYPVLTTFIVANCATIFTNQINLFSFFAGTAPEGVQTYGYYLYKGIKLAKSPAEYPPLAAMGLILTAITLPIVLLTKYLLEKFGPRED